LVIGPQRVALDVFTIANNESNQISEALFGITLDIKIHAHRRAWEFGCAKHVDRSVPDGQCMQRVVAQLQRGIGALAAALGPKGMRELGEREHTIAGVSLDRLFADAAEKAQIVLPDGLITAAVTERADAATARGWSLIGARNPALAEAVAPIAMQRPQPIEGNPSEILVAPQPPGCFRQQWLKQRPSPKG
jgi:hypothetical protein